MLRCMLAKYVNLSHNGFSLRSQTFHRRFFCSRLISLLLVAAIPLSRSFFLFDMLLLTLSTACPLVLDWVKVDCMQRSMLAPPATARSVSINCGVTDTCLLVWLLWLRVRSGWLSSLSLIVFTSIEKVLAKVNSAGWTAGCKSTGWFYFSKYFFNWGEHY